MMLYDYFYNTILVLVSKQYNKAEPNMSTTHKKTTMTRRKAGYQCRTRSSTIENDNDNESEENVIPNNIYKTKIH